MPDATELKRVSVGSGVLLLAAAGVLAAPYISSSTWFAPEPCAEPIAYRIGSVDSRFGISEEEFAVAVRAGAALWNDAAGKQVFVESGEDALPVSLAFDDRQRATQTAERIDAAQAETEAARAEIEEKRASLARRADALDASVKAFNRRADAYQQEVSNWNAQGGAPPAEHERLERERRALETEQERLSQEARSVDAYSNRIGQEVDVLNERIRQINANVDKFNETSAHEFEQGLYIEDSAGKRIVIYEFSDRDELVWVLAHEFGHALGLDHVDDREAVMYARNLGEAPELSATDRSALAALCSAS